MLSLPQAHTNILRRYEQVFVHNMCKCLFVLSHYNHYFSEYIHVHTNTHSHTISAQMYTANVLVIGAKHKREIDLNVGLNSYFVVFVLKKLFIRKVILASRHRAYQSLHYPLFIYVPSLPCNFSYADR